VGYVWSRLSKFAKFTRLWNDEGLLIQVIDPFFELFVGPSSRSKQRIYTMFTPIKPKSSGVLNDTVLSTPLPQATSTVRRKAMYVISGILWKNPLSPRINRRFIKGPFPFAYQSFEPTVVLLFLWFFIKYSLCRESHEL